MLNARVMFWRADDLVFEIINLLEVRDALALASVSLGTARASFCRALTEGAVVFCDGRRAHVCEHIWTLAHFGLPSFFGCVSVGLHLVRLPWI
jgi:hypothetical protein